MLKNTKEEVSMPQNIYFDESGFTGNKLLDPNQTMFAYASIATSDEEAKEFVERLIKKYGIQGGELKGSRLIKYNKGRQAISEIFTFFSGRIKVSISDKKYALAGKFFEYIFEPCLSKNNILFYNINFHRFIANILYLEFSARGAGAEEIFTEFEKLMRSYNQHDFSSLFSSSISPENSPVMEQIREFALSQKDNIKTELQSLPDDGVGKWILDLTSTSLFSLLADWGTEYEQLKAICDNSKPLQYDQELYDVMINRSDKLFSRITAKEHPISFNLSESIQLVDSKEYHGVQLADSIAAACVYATTDTKNKAAQKWLKHIPDIAIYGSLMPELEYIDLNEPNVQINALVLQELHSRATQGLSLLDGMPEYLQTVSQALTYNPMQLNA